MLSLYIYELYDNNMKCLSKVLGHHEVPELFDGALA